MGLGIGILVEILIGGRAAHGSTGFMDRLLRHCGETNWQIVAQTKRHLEAGNTYKGNELRLRASGNPR